MKIPVVLACVCLLVCCSSPALLQPTSTVGISPLPADSLISPPPVSNSPVSTPVTLSDVSEYVPPAPVDGLAVITGRLGVENTRQPMAGAEVYLGEHIGSTVETPLYGFDPSVAPHAVVGDDGRFLFKNVQPGRYVFIVWNSVSPVLVSDTESGVPLDISVEAGQTVELGLLFEPMQ